MPIDPVLVNQTIIIANQLKILLLIGGLFLWTMGFSIYWIIDFRKTIKWKNDTVTALKQTVTAREQEIEKLRIIFERAYIERSENKS